MRETTVNAKKSKVLPTDGPTDGLTDRPTDQAGYRVACTRLKTDSNVSLSLASKVLRTDGPTDGRTDQPRDRHATDIADHGRLHATKNCFGINAKIVHVKSALIP